MHHIYLLLQILVYTYIYTYLCILKESECFMLHGSMPMRVVNYVAFNVDCHCPSVCISLPIARMHNNNCYGAIFHCIILILNTCVYRCMPLLSMCNFVLKFSMRWQHLIAHIGMWNRLNGLETDLLEI